MKIQEALKVLGLPDGQVTPKDIKTAYRKAAFQFHPDRNPAGLEMMKIINTAYEVAKDFSGDFTSTEHTQPNAEEKTTSFSETINQALMAIMGLNLTIEILGTWIWVTGDTKTHKETLKTAGYRWSPKKSAWYFREEENKTRFFKRTHSMDEIRAKYNSQSFRQKKIAA